MESIGKELATTWAESMFGTAALGDVRRNRRVISMVAAVAQRPGGTIAAVFDNPAELAGAYDLVENNAVDPAALAEAIARDAAERARRHFYVWVATDGTSHTITDRTQSKGTGRLTAARMKTRGDKIHDALVIDPDGVPLGLSSVQSWQRPNRPARKSHGRRDTADKETQRWLDARAQTRDALGEHAPGVVCHFLHDREADCWPVLLDAIAHREGEFTTVRAQWDRRLVASDPTADSAAERLREALAGTEVLGELELDIPAGPGRSARTARLEVRACAVTLDLRDRRRETHYAAPVYVVCAREVGTAPAGCKALEWLLLTTYPADTLEACFHLVRGYSFRWRIERFHLAWKSACTDVEATQLWDSDHRARWSLILASVAVLMMRCQFLALEAPDTDAREVFTESEIEAVRDMQKAQVVPEQGRVTLWQMVVAIAYLGGWPGSNKRPPGLVPLTRGWQRVAAYILGTRRRDERARRQEITAKLAGKLP